MFVDFQGRANPRARFCVECREKKDQESREVHFNGCLASEINAMNRYKARYQDDWKSKAVPCDFFLVLFMERDFCPYCGKSFREDQIRKDYFIIREKYQVDHMNPLHMGGEDSLVNALCVCEECNLKKGHRAFSSWLEKLPPEFKQIAEQIYCEKLGYSPHQFVPSEPVLRSPGGSYEFFFDNEQ